jgi:peptidoglycan-N-acetylglucosamine deacetylase
LVAALCNIYIGILLHHGQPDRATAPNRIPVVIPKAIVLPKQQKDTEAESVVFGVPKPLQGKTIARVKAKDTSHPVIALTFDDGPWQQNTPKILEILKREQIKATFFWIGKMVENSPQIAKQVVAEGHAIGNHTWHHWYRRMKPAIAAQEIESTASIIYKVTGVKTALFRPPGGILTNGLANYAKKENYAVVMWSDDSKDYRPYSTARLVRNVLRQIKSGGIVLMHDGGGDRKHTVEALPKIIATLKKRGYEFVTVPELLEM